MYRHQREREREKTKHVDDSSAIDHEPKCTIVVPFAIGVIDNPRSQRRLANLRSQRARAAAQPYVLRAL